MRCTRWARSSVSGATSESPMDGCDRFGVVVRAVELGHAHAPEPQARNRRAVAAERARLHGDLLADRMRIFCAALHCSTNTQEEGGAGGPGDSSAAPARGARGARQPRPRTVQRVPQGFTALVMCA